MVILTTKKKHNPLTIAMLARGFILLLIATAHLHLQAQPKVWDSFEGGNVNTIQTTADGFIHVSPTHKLNDTKKIWLYFAAKNLGKKTTLHVTLEKPNYLNEEIVYSYDQINWQKMKGQLIPNTSTYKFEKSFEQDCVFVATTYPYVYSQVIKLAESLEPTPQVKKSFLCYSPGGRAVPIIKIGNPNAENMIWMIARQHAFEAPTSYFMEGIVRYLNEQQNHKLLSNYCFYIVPMMDVDACAEGASGKDQNPIDMNRNWAHAAPYWPQVAQVKQQVFQTALNHNLVAFFDLHSPFPHNNGSHYYSIVGYKPQQETNIKKFYALYNKLCGVNHWQHSTKQAPSRGRGWVSGGEGLQPYFPDVDFTVTNEQAFHIAGTQTLYTDYELIKFGNQYAQALLKYLSQR